MEVQYASNGKANAGLTTGIIGTALSGLLAIGGLGLAANNTASTSTYATTKDIENMKELMAKDQQIAILTSEQNTEVKIADVYERIMTRVNSDQREQAAWNAQQAVNNATMSAAIATNAGSIASLRSIVDGITATYVPADQVTPTPMNKYNSWTAPTTTTTTA